MSSGDAASAGVAVIVAMKDAEATIARAIGSALGEPQTAEVVVVDDGSTDRGPAIVSSMAAEDPRLKLIRRSESAGPAAARNLAIAESRAPFIAILDADDYWTQGRLARLLALAQDRDIAADDPLVVREGEPAASGGPLIGGLDAPVELELEAFLLGNVRRKDRFRREWGFLKPLIRREFLHRTGLAYQPELRLGEDFILYSQALARGARFLVTGPCGYVSVQRPHSLSVSHTAQDLAHLLIAARRLGREPLTAAEARALRRYLRDLTVKTRYRQVLDARKAGGIGATAKVLLSHADALPAALLGRLAESAPS